MEMRAITPAGVRVLACRVPVVRSLALANHRLFTSTPPVCGEPASQYGASPLGLWCKAASSLERLQHILGKGIVEVVRNGKRAGRQTERARTPHCFERPNLGNGLVAFGDHQRLTFEDAVQHASRVPLDLFHRDIHAVILPRSPNPTLLDPLCAVPGQARAPVLHRTMAARSVLRPPPRIPSPVAD